MCVLTSPLTLHVGEPYWGQGIALWAIRAALKCAFDERSIVWRQSVQASTLTVTQIRMEATVFEGNEASEKILTRAGFHLESHNPYNVFKRGVLKSTKKYVLICDRNVQSLVAKSTSAT